MHYYLTLTSKCNLRCKYCYGKTVEDFLTKEEEENYDFTLPPKSNILIENLIRLSNEDPNFSITFYGGEPLLEIEKIKEIMDKVKVKNFMLQTNGIFLNKLDKKYINKLKN